MKLWQIKKGERFRAVFHDENTDNELLSVTGISCGIDGMYAKVKYDGVEYTDEAPFSYLACATEVEHIKENQ